MPLIFYMGWLGIFLEELKDKSKDFDYDYDQAAPETYYRGSLGGLPIPPAWQIDRASIKSREAAYSQLYYRQIRRQEPLTLKQTLRYIFKGSPMKEAR